MERILFFVLTVTCCGCWGSAKDAAEVKRPDPGYWTAKASNAKEYRITQTETWVRPGIEKTEQGYLKALGGKWRVDSAAFRRELNLWANGVTHRLMKNESQLPQYREYFAAVVDEWTRGIGTWKLDLKEDGTRITTEDPGHGTFGFSPALDTIYYKGENGKITDRFRLLTVSPDSLVLARYVPVNERDSTSYLRFKYIR